MLTYSFDHIGKASMYEHLYSCIKNDIGSGVLHAGEKLPSKRSLAANLGISTVTVENAYNQLISEGYVCTIPKKGYFVADIPRKSDRSKAIPAPEIRLPAPKKQYEIDLSGNQISSENFPFTVWARLMRETISDRSEELMQAAPGGGILLLRQAIAEHLHAFRGMNVDPAQILIGAGTEYLYGMLVQLFGKDKIYCVENPGYQKITQIYRCNEAECRFAGMDEQGLSVASLRQTDADIVHISPTHHFPTGITMPIGRRYELLAWANEREGRYIIEDDYDSEFRLDGRPIPALQSIDVSEKVIYMNTFSKSLASTMRIGYMVLPPHLVNRFYEKMSFYACTVSNFEQYTLAEFMRRGYFEKHINRMRLFYAKARSRVLSCIRSCPLAPFCEIEEKDSGLHFLLRLHTELEDQTICRSLEEKGIHLAALSEYDQEGKAADRHVFLLSYSHIDLEKLPYALETIKSLLEQGAKS